MPPDPPCDGAITPSPAPHHNQPAEPVAYSTSMIDATLQQGGRRAAMVLRDRLLRRAWLVAVVVQLLDAFTTAAGLHIGLPERNPFTVSVLRIYGSAGLLLQKAVIDCMLLAAMAKLPRRTALLSVGLVTAVTALVVGANLLGLLAAG